MTVLAKHLALMACMLGLSGTAPGFCATSDVGRPLPPLISLASHREYVHSPPNLPARPRPFVVCLREAGIDEEDNDKPDAHAVFAGAGPVGGRSRLSDLLAGSAPDRVSFGRPTSYCVLRC